MKNLSNLGVQAYLAGLTFALAASPCSTPVLATILGYVAATKVVYISFVLVYLLHCFAFFVTLSDRLLSEGKERNLVTFSLN